MPLDDGVADFFDTEFVLKLDELELVAGGQYFATGDFAALVRIVQHPGYDPDTYLDAWYVADLKGNLLPVESKQLLCLLQETAKLPEVQCRIERAITDKLPPAPARCEHTLGLNQLL